MQNRKNAMSKKNDEQWKKNDAILKKTDEALKTNDKTPKKSDAAPRDNGGFGFVETIEAVKIWWTPPWTWGLQEWREAAEGLFLGLLGLLVYSVVASVAVGIAIILVAGLVVFFSVVRDALDIITGRVVL